MKIEIEKFYRTRRGEKVRIYAVDETEPWPIHGAIRSRTGWTPCAWKANGFFLENDTDDHDIVSEWEEPKPKLKAWIVDGVLKFNESEYVIGFKGKKPSVRRAPWLDEPVMGITYRPESES